MAFWRYVFGTFGNEANIITIYSLVAFPPTPKYMTVNDLEWPFCVKFCFGPVCLKL